MKLQFLELPDAERRLYIEQAAIRRGFSPVIMEKDFWVCWLLSILFESEFAGDLVFKGGTSLSKVFGVIDRFSEDIDLSLSPQFLNLPETGTSRTQANKWMAKAEAACSLAVQNLIAPVLEAAALNAIGDRSEAWFEFFTDPATHSPVLLFHYPATQPDGFAYLKRSVKLEFGSLTDQQPTGRHPVRRGSPAYFPKPFLTGSAKWSHWRCSGPSGRKPPYSTRNSTVPLTSPPRTASRAITPTRPHWQHTPTRAMLPGTTKCATGSCTGKAGSSAVHGRDMKRRYQDHSASCRRQQGFLR
jgi:hypothetical protein